MLLAIKILSISLIAFAILLIGVCVYYTEKLEKAYTRRLYDK